MCCARLVRPGYALASISYRVTSDGAVVPEPLDDVKAAIRYLRLNAGTWNLDPNRVALFGSSAGGHLVTLAAATFGIVEGAEPGGTAWQSVEVEELLIAFLDATLGS